jgi:flagellar basal body-associated protein FliL
MAEETEDQVAAGADPPAETAAPPQGPALKLVFRAGLVVAVVAACSAAGMGLARLLRAPDEADAAAVPQTPGPGPHPAPGLPSADEEYGYYDLEPIVANLHDPRRSRYIRATITLATRKGDLSGVQSAVERRSPELKNWLIEYLSGQALDEVGGQKNINRMRREIRDSFNDQLWPNHRPLIHHVLFKQFVIQ